MEAKVIESNVDAELLARAVAEEIDATGIAKDGKVIYQGKIMTRTEAAKEIDRESTKRHNLGVATFDPLIAIDDTMLPDMARVMLKRNLVYGSLYRIVNAARSLIYELQGENGMPLKDFCTLLESGIDAESIFGSAAYSSGIHRVAALIALAKAWKADYLREIRIHNIRDNMPSLEDVINEPPRMSEVELTKMVSAAKIVAEEAQCTDEEIAQAEAMARQKYAEELKFKINMHEVMKGAIKLVIDTAMQLDIQVEFYELPVETQAQVLESIIKSIDKLPQQLVKNPRVNVGEMVMAVGTLKKLKHTICKVLEDPRFATVDNLSL